MSKKPLFGIAGEEIPQPGRQTIKRDQGGHERWADAILPADAEAGALETQTNHRPLLLLVLAVIGVAAILAVQLFHLQIINGQHNLGLADGNRIRQKVTRAPRGVIYDRNKVQLARNEASFDVTVIPSLLPRDAKARQDLYVKVASLTGIDAGTIAAKAETDCVKSEQDRKHTLQLAEQTCLYLAQPKLIASGVPRDQALIFDEASSDTPGFSLDVNPIREYLDGGALSSIMGYTARVSQADLVADDSYLPTDYIGKLGIESQYEDILRGQNGSEQTEVDAAGHPVKLLSSKAAVPGSNIMLSIDFDLQKQLAGAITKQLQASGATQAAGVALNPKTGEILAAVNLPTYDNNLFAKGISQTDYTKLINDKAQPLFNKVINGAYPTGSIIKPLVASAVLQEHTISLDTTVNDTGSLEITNQYDSSVKYTFRSYEPGGLGVVNLVKAIAVSSNVFFYTVGGGYGNIPGLGVRRLDAYYHKFGLGQKPNVDIPEQTAGLVPSPESKKKATGEDWVLGDTYNISVGQGDLRASPLQMAVATAAIANGGNVIKPHFLKAVLDSNGDVVRTVKPEIVQKGFISPENLQVVRGAMRQVVQAPYGTACCLIEKQVPVAVAAKTGTAETVSSDNGGKNQSKPNAWFEAFAPYDDPQIVIVVMIQNSGEGAQYAAPAVRETLAWCFTRPGGCVKN
jgi:penicillin-binding protein 2